MKNFTELEEKQLITKIWKVHDEIFSMPAKRYIFCIIDGPMIGCAGFAYMFIDENKDNGINKKVIAIEYKDLLTFDFQFGDLLTIVYSNKLEKCKNDFILRREPLNSNFPKHISVIAQSDFLHYRQYIQVYRECLEDYQLKNNRIYPKITQLKAIWSIVEELSDE